VAAAVAREARGSELLRVAMTRGLWDDMLVDLPGLRELAFSYVHNLEDASIDDDFVKAFGKRRARDGDEHLRLDQDGWKELDAITPILNRRFRRWNSGRRRGRKA
jgi:hypothetical protein